MFWIISHLGSAMRIRIGQRRQATDQFTQAFAVSQQMLHGLKNVHLRNQWMVIVWLFDIISMENGPFIDD